MLLQGEEMQKEHYLEVKGLKEIRPGRTLMCRKITFNESSSISADISDGGVHVKTILFIHGSCAASSQYDSLLEGLAVQNRKSLNQNNNGQKKKRTKLVCYLYDQLGCGESTHPPNDWYAYSSFQLSEDLISLTELIIQSMKNEESNSSFYIVGHSHGASQSIRLINALEKKEESTCSSESNITSKIVSGAIFIGGGLKDSQCNVTNDGGHWVFTYTPTFMLNRMQMRRFMSKAFVNIAFHPSTSDEIKDAAFGDSYRNDMAMCKAFYRQQNYADSIEAKSFKTKTLVIHGQDDQILPLHVGKHLHESLHDAELHIIPNASHQVFQEKPCEVAELLLEFIA